MKRLIVSIDLVPSLSAGDQHVLSDREKPYSRLASRAVEYVVCCRAHVRRHHEKSFKCEICATQVVPPCNTMPVRDCEWLCRGQKRATALGSI